MNYDWENGLTEEERTHIGVEVSHDLRCDHDGDCMKRVKWNSLAMAKAMASLYNVEQERDKLRAQLDALSSPNAKVRHARAEDSAAPSVRQTPDYL